MYRQSIFALAILAITGTATASPQAIMLTMQNGALAGPAADILHREIAHAQFILYGEDHGFADSPILLRAIARDARFSGFNHLVVEVGPLSTAMVSGVLAREGTKGVAKLVHDVPLGIPFLSLKEDADLASDFLGADAKGTPYLWGVDQEFIGSPIFHLQRLVALAPNDRARAEASRLLAVECDAAAKAEQQKFLLASADAKSFDALAALFEGQPEARSIIAALKESASIYQAWMQGRNYDNNFHRAALLASNFLAQYHAAADTIPKVVFKMGMEHTALGTTTINTVDLGTLATSIARTNNMTALRIAFLPAGGHNVTFAPRKGNPTTIEAYANPEAKEFFAAIRLDTATLPKAGWALIPLEPIRQSLDTAGIEALKPFARFTLIGFDYVITTPDAKAATFLY